MEQGMSSSTSGSAFQNKSKTTSAPTSPLKEKKASFFGKVRHNKTQCLLLGILSEKYLSQISI
jgi:hypothetical protein